MLVAAILVMYPFMLAGATLDRPLAPLHEAIDARAALPQGRVELSLHTMTAERASERRLDCSFAQACFRVDRLRDAEWDGALNQIKEDRDWVWRRAWDGKTMVRAAPGFGSFAFVIQDADSLQFGELDARWLGIPLVDPASADPAAPFAGAQLLSCEQVADETRLELRLNRALADKQPIDSIYTLVFDHSKGGALVRYSLDEAYNGSQWHVAGEAIIGQFGSSWYPEWFRREQYRNGQFEFALEYHVLAADFDTPVSESSFTAGGLGARRGEAVASQVSGVGTQVWNGAALEPYKH